MSEIEFRRAFEDLTEHAPFPWQEALYERLAAGDPPGSCDLPTGLGKTSVIPIWLIALANQPERVPRRLVYVVNRRTVVDQATNEAEEIRKRLQGSLRDRLSDLCAEPDVPLGISTLRGEFADNREWSADPSRPAVIVGTVDMIGSRLLFSGYGLGFKTKPLHAGFLGQDALLVHDEAHLEPAFQELIEAIRDEQKKEPAPLGEQKRLRVMQLTATSRGGETFGLTDWDRAVPEVSKRIHARKNLRLHPIDDPKKLADQIAELALAHKEAKRTILVYARTVEVVEKVAAKLRKEEQKVETLTGTLRGKERDDLVKSEVFGRYLPKAEGGDDTVYLVCTSAGEVGVNISADHMVCDLSTFESMAQRFGRVNRFGKRDDTQVDAVHPTKLDEDDEYESRLKKTLDLLRQLDGDASPNALAHLDPDDRREAFSPEPPVLLTSDILFDVWALTTVRGKLPGRPPVAPYLHGDEDDKQKDTSIAWREEVYQLKDAELTDDQLTKLLVSYRLKPHELLRDSTYRKNTGVRDKLAKLAKLVEKPGEIPAWVQEPGGDVYATTLEELPDLPIAGRTVILPPEAGGLAVDKNQSRGLLDGTSTYDRDHRSLYDVADELQVSEGPPARCRQRTQGTAAPPVGMRRVATIRRRPEGDDSSSVDDDSPEEVWTHLQFFTRPKAADDDLSMSSCMEVTWDDHTRDVTDKVSRIVEKLCLPKNLKIAVILAARFHDLGKTRTIFQRMLGNFDPGRSPLAKSGGKTSEFSDYRHEFGSLVDLSDDEQKFKGILDQQPDEIRELVLHLIATHHGRGRPHFPNDEVFDPEPKDQDITTIAAQVSRRFARLQRRYGRWGLAYLESLLRAADYAASAAPTPAEAKS